MTELCFLLLHNGSPETPRLTSLINSKSNLYPKHFWLSARLTRDAGSSNVSFTDTSIIKNYMLKYRWKGKTKKMYFHLQISLGYFTVTWVNEYIHFLAKLEIYD